MGDFNSAFAVDLGMELPLDYTCNYICIKNFKILAHKNIFGGLSSSSLVE